MENNNIITDVKHIVFPADCDCLHENITTSLNDTGRLLAVRVNLRKILCNKTLNVGVLVFDGKILKGFKVKQLHTGCHSCKYIDVKTPPFYFVFCDNNICCEKNIRIKVIANYTNLNCSCQCKSNR